MKKSTFLVLFCLVALTFEAAPAAILTWDITPGTVGAGDGVVTGGAGNWNTTGTNGVWTSDGGLNNVAWTNNATAPNSAIFGGGSGSPIAVTVGTVNVQDITFNATTSGNYALSSGTITLGNTTAGVQAPTPTITANVNASIGSVLAGNDGLSKTGGGTLTLTGANTFSGGTTIDNGILALGLGGATGTIRGAVTVNSGATLQTTVANATGYSAGVKIDTLNLNGGTFNNTATGDQAFAMTVNLTGGTMQSNGGVSSNSTNSYFSLGGGAAINSLASASQSVVAGRIHLREGNPSNRLVFDVANGAAATDLLVSAAITASAGTYAITKQGAGVMELSGANTFTGGVTVDGGTLIASSSSALGTGGTIVVNSGAALNWTANGYNSFPSRTLNIVGGTVSLNSATNNAHNYTGQTLTMQGGTLTSINGPGGAANDGGFGNFVLNNSTLIVSGSAQSTISTTTFATAGAAPNFNVGVTGAAVDLLVQSRVISGAIIKNGLGTMTLASNDTYAGSTTVNQGVLNVTGRSGAYNGAISVGSGALMTVVSASGINLGGAVSGAGVLENNGSSFAYFNGAATQFAGFTGTLKTTSGSTYLAFGPGNGAVNTKVQVDGGNFVIGANGSGAGTWQIGELSGTGGSVWAAASGSGVHTLQVGALNTDSTYAGVIRNLISGGSATTGLTKVGSGSLTLSGANVYTGNTTVSGGTLKVAAGGVIYADAYQPSAVLTVQSGGILELNNWNYDQSVAHTQSLGGLRANANAIVVDGGTIRITGATPTSYSRGFTIGANGATLEAAAGANWTLGFDAATPAVNSANGDLTLSGAGTGVFDKVLSGSAAVSLTKSGAGIWALTAANTYAGGTQISGGTLFVNNSSGSATGTGAVSLLANATLAGSGSISGLVTTAAASSTFSPGNSPGTLSLLGGLNAAAGATFNFELGTISDQINLGSSLFTGSTSANGLRFIFADAGGLTTGVTYTLLTFGLSSNLDYSDLFILSKPSGVTLDASFGVGGWLINGNNLQVQFMVVPEPSTSLLLALGLVGIGCAARRRAVQSRKCAA